MKKTLFTFPYYSYHVSPDTYNKEELVNNMLANYQKKPSRNHWQQHCDMHHEYNDKNNPDFIQINYKQLISSYTNIVQQFMNELNFRFPVEWTLQMQNYTVTTNSQTMSPHNHLPAQFAAVHYLKFDSSHHPSTVFHNPSQYQNILPVYYTSLYNTLIPKSLSCILPELTIPAVEDELIIFPAMLNHSIGCSHSDVTRITTAFNIYIKESE